MNDIDLAEDDACLPYEVCHPTDRGAVRRAARLVHSLRTEFSYVRSPCFLREVAGKSDEYIAMRTKLEDQPSKRGAHLASLNGALRAILSARDAYDLVQPTQHADLDALADVLRGCSNPE